MLAVWCVCVGTKYTRKDVAMLHHQVSQHLSQPFIMRCISDRNLRVKGVETVLAPHSWPGWWQKLMVFHFARHGLNLYLDLDVVVVGGLADLLDYRLSLPSNWAQSGFGGCQSSVMAWGRDYSYITENFNPQLLTKPANGNYGYYGPQKLWGDQEYITEMCGPPGGDVIEQMQGIYSYKYHCRDNGTHPADARVICFHGNPKPEEVDEAWVKKARSYTTTRA